MTKKVTIYNPQGVAEQHTIPNARDLINAGWSYDKNRKTTPFDSLPRAVALTAEQTQELNKKKIGQEIFDRYGTDATREIIVPKPEGFVEGEPAPVADPTEEVTPEPVVEEASPVEVVQEAAPVVEEPVPAPVVEEVVAPAKVELPRAEKRNKKD